jgi:hypothetical protein
MSARTILNAPGLDKVTRLQAAAIQNLDEFMWTQQNPYMRHYDRNNNERLALSRQSLSGAANVSDCWDICSRNYFSNENCFVECQKQFAPETQASLSRSLTYYRPGTR